MASCALTLSISALCLLTSSSEDAESSSLSCFALKFCGRFWTPKFRGWRWSWELREFSEFWSAWPPETGELIVGWFMEPIEPPPNGSPALANDTKFGGRGRPMYCERIACRGAPAGHGGGNTRGMNQGKPPDDGEPDSPPGRPAAAVCKRCAWRESSFTPGKYNNEIFLELWLRIGLDDFQTSSNSCSALFVMYRFEIIFRQLLNDLEEF